METIQIEKGGEIITAQIIKREPIKPTTKTVCIECGREVEKEPKQYCKCGNELFPF